MVWGWIVERCARQDKEFLWFRRGGVERVIKKREGGGEKLMISICLRRALGEGVWNEEKQEQTQKQISPWHRASSDWLHASQPVKRCLETA